MGPRKLLQTLPYPSAVFDLHFLPAQPLFAIVSSTGTIALFKIVESLEVTSPVSNDTGLVKIENIAIHQVFTGDIAPTFFTWAPHSQHLMAISTSDGGVYLVRFSAEYQSFDILNNGNPVTRHSEYAWCCSFSGSGDRLFSGGDDNKLRLENLDTALSASNPEYSIVPSELHPKGLSGHDAGVTFILPIPLPEVEGKTQLLLTGSYDDHIRILAIPPYPSRPKILTELHLGGGVWRLRFVESSPGLTNNGIDRIFKYTVLASCMHAGAKILSITGIKQHSGDSLDWDWKIKVLAEMNLHKSMNYASDIQTIHCTKGIDHPRTRLCVSSSFYDRLLCVWDWDQGEDS
jgi:diphthamide biosynthesis protein 7